jgi:hypothetical protein
LGSGQSLGGLYRLQNARIDMVDAIAGSEDGEDAWEFADWAPEVAVGMLQEQIRWEQRDFDAMPERADSVIPPTDGGEGEVCDVTGADKVGIGPAFGLAVGLDDAPRCIAAARDSVPIVGRSRIGRI